MKWLAGIIFVFCDAKRSQHVEDTTLSTTFNSLDEQFSNQTVPTNATLSITESINANIQFDSGVIYRGFVVSLFCSFIFFCSCCVKRKCKKKKFRRYDILEDNGLNVAESDSDEIDIFEKIQK